MNSLENKTIFITGSGGVLGTTYCDYFLQNGAKVIATDLKGRRAENLNGRFSSHQEFSFYNLDVSDENNIEDVFKSIISDGHQPNVILNNAAITGELLMNNNEEFPDFGNTKLETWTKALNVNLTGAFLIARQIDRDLIGKYPLKLINIASMYALNAPHHEIYEGMPFKSFSAYSASKAGIHGLTLWLASYWAKHQATVNTISPGAVFNGHSDEFSNRVSKLIMAGRMAEPKEIAEVMCFLCSDASNYMTGQMINVDGGFSGW